MMHGSDQPFPAPHQQQPSSGSAHDPYVSSPAAAFAAAVVSVVESGGSGISQYSPISTLERQYRGHCILLFVKLNANCCLPGGVESVLKLARQRKQAGVDSAASSGDSNHSQHQENLSSFEATSSNRSRINSASSATSVASSTASDPFSFLGQSEEPAAATTASTTSATVPKKSNSGSGPNLGRFLKKVAATTSQQLERGMQTLAIRADGGKNPDLLTAGLYLNGNTLWSLTESLPMPAETARLQGLSFSIPLAAPLQGNVTLKVWIRSGATLLGKSAKNYLIGSAVLNMEQLQTAMHRQTQQQQQQQQQQSTTTTPAASLNVTLQSAVVVDGHAQLLVTPDTKFPPLCAAGWSLADPLRASYSPASLHNWPLHQPYGMSSSPFVMATERTTESTVILPICAQVAHLAARAAQKSLVHAQSVTQRLAAVRHDTAIGEYALCQVQAGALQLMQTTATAAAVNPSMQPNLLTTWQRSDSIFEVEVAAPVPLPVMPIVATTADNMHVRNITAEQFEAVHSVSFFPKPCRNGVLPGILQTTPLPPNGFLLGNLRLQITVPPAGGCGTGLVTENPFEPTATTTSTHHHHHPRQHLRGIGGTIDPHQQLLQIWECVVSLDAMLQTPAKHNVPVPYPVFNATGEHVGNIAVVMSIHMEQGPAVPATACSAAGGLVALTGLPVVVEDVHPAADYDPVAIYRDNPDRERRRQQLVTMGAFLSHGYMEQHVLQTRSPDALHWNERAVRYRAAIQMTTTSTTASAQRLPPHEDRSARPFRPSSSRSDVILAGIPFNVHTASFSLDPIVADPTAAQPAAAGAVFYNITCGAPADHARGFSNIFQKKDAPAVGLNSPVGPVSGGLRRLEAKRLELAALVSNLQTCLTMAVANYFVEKRQINRSQACHHVPPRHPELADLRWKLFEAVQSLHHVTWHCAMRRSVAFSQAVGIAISSYLASLSNPTKWQSTSWPAVWARHGYLVSFEGLLSAAGNELGMIEDASVGISMLSMVKVVIVPDAAAAGTAANNSSVPVPNSPYLKWIRLTPSGASPEVEYILQIGMVQSYYDQRIPDALKNGTPVRLYPLLFEVGVDIRQWGAHAGSNMKTSIQNNLQSSNASGTVEKGVAAASPSGGGLLEDEDDDVGDTDDDVLVQLNSEAFQKLNAYAHAVSPAAGSRTHPMLATLYQHIVSSAGRINHDIVDEAATLAQQLGGGGVVFCKSGKDRTAMHVTYKQAQFATRYRRRSNNDPSKNNNNPLNPTLDQQLDNSPSPRDSTLQDATLMRVYGTRLPICEKNVGESKYAFNSLQVKFMPDALKPPMQTLAGFLKGGKVFTGGGIES